MRLTLDQFRQWRHRNITLLGMSGVGKTHLASMLREHEWFHYSVDYRIGTRYLDEEIMDLIKWQAMQVPFLRDLLRKDWIYIRNNIKVNDLGPVLSFVGKLGNPELGGVPLEEFQRRQALYRAAEIRAIHDIRLFIDKAQDIYGYSHLVNDVAGSLCDLEDDGAIGELIRHTLILYIEVTEPEEEQELIRRAQSSPKPLYFRPDFLQLAVRDYLAEHNMEYAAEMDPEDFTRWVFPRLFAARVPRYRAIADPHGYTVTSREVSRVRDEADFIEMVERAIDRQQGG
ncbi:MAG TPA: ATPase [Sedimenticola thiotaurini]|uniref:ATPase n=1 Tax=Sedimenticola thiotaurini TaxID=1543721 RepID=A0A831RJY4_9GAMM|nr:ATPase [Sedimenticola thiotaurini]